MGWKIIEIEEMCSMKIFIDSLVVARNKKLIIPINDIDTLIISNNRINITINLINELSSKGVCVIFCDGKYIPKSLLLGFNVKKQSYKVFQKQMQWSDEFKKNWWNNISFKKITNQLDLMKKYKLSTNDWELFIMHGIDYKTNNYESQVANLFFHSLYGNEFNRDKRTEINYIL
ncbi:MAG: type II CRISPR-associated endonuclease Cas1, partial [Mycoplasmataceae bacterium]|nr:type II CRISPR-associated endonuclease Cas1 [Mycoplasmataceae bacterium]